MQDRLGSIPLSAIRVFEAAARLGSFTRAAEALGISQAAVSWQVKALERRLDQALFVRRPREVTLTVAGERLARAATEALSLLRAALTDLAETDDGVLAITTVQSLAGQWLAPRLGSFQLAHPQIAVRLETTPRRVDLARENVDIGLRAGSGVWPGLESHYLLPTVQTPLCAPELLARLGGLAAPEDLLTAPRVGSPEEWADWFAAAGVIPRERPVTPRLMADGQAVEMASALAGQGVALGSPIFFATEIAQGRLARPFEAVAANGGGFWLVYPTERRRVRKIAAFRDWILARVAEDPNIARYASSRVTASTRADGE